MSRNGDWIKQFKIFVLSERTAGFIRLAEDSVNERQNLVILKLERK